MHLAIPAACAYSSTIATASPKRNDGCSFGSVAHACSASSSARSRAQTAVKRAVRERRRLRRISKARRLRLVSMRRNKLLYKKFGITSKIINMLVGAAPGMAAPKSQRKGGLLAYEIPAQFSFLQRPEDSLRVLIGFSAKVRAQRPSEYYLDQGAGADYDLGSNGILGVLIDEIATEARSQGRRLKWRGKYPQDPATKRFIKALGPIKRLHIVHEYLKPSVAVRLEVFDARAKHYDSLVRPRSLDRKGQGDWRVCGPY